MDVNLDLPSIKTLHYLCHHVLPFILSVPPLFPSFALPYWNTPWPQMHTLTCRWCTAAVCVYVCVPCLRDGLVGPLLNYSVPATLKVQAWIKASCITIGKRVTKRRAEEGYIVWWREMGRDKAKESRVRGLSFLPLCIQCLLDNSRKDKLERGSRRKVIEACRTCWKRMKRGAQGGNERGKEREAGCRQGRRGARGWATVDTDVSRLCLCQCEIWLVLSLIRELITLTPVTHKQSTAGKQSREMGKHKRVRMSSVCSQVGFFSTFQRVSGVVRIRACTRSHQRVCLHVISYICVWIQADMWMFSPPSW